MPILSDAVKKILIIGSTGPLPRSLRIRSRERLLADLEMGIADRSELLIIGHPKSGNTWLKAMLSRLYQVRYGMPERLVNKSDEYSRRNPEIPRMAATNACYSYEGAVGRALAPEAADNPLKHKAVMLLARNPLDIAVSWYMQFTKRQSARKQELINHNLRRPIDRRTVEMWEFVRHSEIGLPFLIDYLNTWARNIDALPRGSIVRYEDLRQRTAETLARVLELMGAVFSEQEIEAAVQWGSFENLRKLEVEGFFRQGGMTLRNKKDEESFKVRRAKVGGYRDYFSPEQVAELEALVNDGLSPVFGYTPVAPAIYVDPPDTAAAAAGTATGTPA
ncbi:MAG: sulfotransferase domain-containing protein [Gammaproteobacteria bacterium]